MPSPAVSRGGLSPGPQGGVERNDRKGNCAARNALPAVKFSGNDLRLRRLATRRYLSLNAEISNWVA